MPPKDTLLSGTLLASDMKEIAHLKRVVLLARPSSPRRLMKGIAEVSSTALSIRSHYWLRIQTIGMLRIKPIEVESHARGRLILHFVVVSTAPDITVNGDDGG